MEVLQMSNDALRHRKGKIKLTLKQSDGTPVRNARVTVEQTGHSFQFGCSEFECIPYVNGLMDDRQKEQAAGMFDKFFRLFNTATLPFYWGRFEPVRGKPQTEQVRKAALWFKSKGIDLKGHPLCWHTVTAQWLLDLSNEEILAAQLDRINREVSDFKGIVDIWDVINEAVIMPVFDKYDNGITRICKDLGRIRLIKKVFEATRQANPDAVLLINDFDTSEAYAILIEGCLEAGVRIDAIGIQSHMHQGYWGVEKTLRVLERFSRFNLPLHFTENTIVSGDIMPRHIVDLNDFQVSDWPSTPEGEERQAQETVTHYKTLFAHPLVESITWWNFVDGRWLNAPAGFLRRDYSPKPVYFEIDRLVNEEWRTGPHTLVTDDMGSVEISGYLGTYELRLKDKTISFRLDKGSTEEAITV